MKLMIPLILSIVLSLTGCSILSSKEVTVGCQVADVATTTVALKAGAIESNPILAAVGLPGTIVLKGLLIYFLIKHYEEINKTALAAVNGVTCGTAVNNLLILR